MFLHHTPTGFIMRGVQRQRAKTINLPAVDLSRRIYILIGLQKISILQQTFHLGHSMFVIFLARAQNNYKQIIFIELSPIMVYMESQRIVLKLEPLRRFWPRSSPAVSALPSQHLIPTNMFATIVAVISTDWWQTVIYRQSSLIRVWTIQKKRRQKVSLSTLPWCIAKQDLAPSIAGGSFLLQQKSKEKRPHYKILWFCFLA